MRPCSLMLYAISQRLRSPPPPMSSLQSPVIPSLFPNLLLPLIPFVRTICIPLRPVPPCPLFFPLFIRLFFAFKVNVFLTYQFLDGVPMSVLTVLHSLNTETHHLQPANKAYMPSKDVPPQTSTVCRFIGSVW